MLDKDGYPTDEELDKVRQWDITQGDIRTFLAYLYTLWRMTDWGFKQWRYGGKIKLALHTGGWSGNESIIEALQENVSLFWMLYWQKSTRGGHYWFEIYQLK